jgi:signal peptidase I, bacterial type
MRSKREVEIPGILADDDRDIQIIEDLASMRRDPGSRSGLWSETRSLLRDIFFAIVVAVLIVVFIVQPVRVEGQSMMPRLFDQDRIFVNKFIYPLREWLGDREPIKRGDIVVLLFPDDPSKSYIKRVVGLPGEKIQIENGRLYVDGTLIDEPYLNTDYVSFDEEGPTEVKAHHYFVMGDNRRNSSDSRAWGLVPEKYIYGKAIFRYYPFLPFEHVGRLE